MNNFSSFPVNLVWILFLVWSGNTINAQTVIRGHISSATEPGLPRATVTLKKFKEGTVADTAGNFSLKTKIKGSQWLFCSATGFQPDSLLINVKGDSLLVNFSLKDHKQQLNGVTISFHKNRIDEVKREYALSDLDIVTTPGAAADVVASLQTMPGAAPAGNETGLFVHGGSANETKAFFDGLLVKNLFGSRLPDLANRSRFSAFLFKETTFSTSGYAAQYGDALSSAISLETKGLAEKTSNEFSLTTLGGGAAHTERFKNSSLVIGANYYNFKVNDRVIPQNTLWVDDPKQYQGSLNYKYKTSKSGMLKVYADYSSTALAFNIINPNSSLPDLLSNTNNNLYLNANYQDYLSSNWKMYAGVAYNYTSENGKVNTTPYDQLDKVSQEKLSFSRHINGTSVLTFGAEQFQNYRSEGYDIMRRGYRDILSAGFSEAEIPLLKSLIIKGGARFEYSDYMKKTDFAPRSSLAWYANSKNELVFSYGTYYEKPDDSFLAQTSDLGFEKAVSYNLDYEYKLSSRSLRIQLYNKNYYDLVKIITPVFSGFQAYGPPVTITGFNNNGHGYARGADIFWRDAKSFKAVEYYLSYSYTDTKRDYIDYTAMAQPTFVPQQTFNTVIKKLILKYKGQISATYALSSGRTYFNPDNPVFLGDKTQWNQNLSIGFSYMPAWFHNFTVIQLAVNNALGLKQVYGYRYAYDGSRRESILPPGKRGVLLSFLMNIDDGWFNH